MNDEQAGKPLEQRDELTEARRRAETSLVVGQTISLPPRGEDLPRIAASERVPDSDESRAVAPVVGEAQRELIPFMPGFQLERVLGKGGMGVVYLAYQPSLKRHVALKMVLGTQIDADEITRFRREAEAVARLRHPQLVQVHEVGEFAGLPYCVLEYVEGGSLAQQLVGQPRGPREAAALVELLARGAHCAHEAGVVHRDLKPANILLTANGEPKIADFGLAKRTDDPAGLTRSGTVLGTPSYMSPEQAEGRLHDVGPLADVYSLGAILYELLTGRPPFRGTTVLDTLAQVCADEPVPPRQLQPTLPIDLETICLKCLEKSPQRRYGSAARLADDLRRWLDGHPIVARPVGRVERFVKWARREPRLATLSATLAAVVIVAFVTIAWQLKVAVKTGNELRETLGEKQKALDAESRALGEKQVALNKEQEARAESQRQARLKQLELDRAERMLYGNRVARAQRELELLDAGHASQLLEDCDQRLRGWEWHALRRLSHRLKLHYAQHPDSLLMRVRSDNRQLLTFRDPAYAPVDEPPTVRAWDAETGREVLVVNGVLGDFSPDGASIAVLTTGMNGTSVVRIFDSSNGNPIRACEGTVESGVEVAFVDEGKAVLAVERAGQVICWDVESGMERYRIGDRTWGMAPGMFGAFTPEFCALSADRSLLALCGGPLIETSTGKVRANLGRHRNAVFSGDGRRVAYHSQSQNNALRVRDTQDGMEIYQRDAPIGPGNRPSMFSNLCLNHDGSKLWCGTGRANMLQGLPGKLVGWRVPTGEVLFDVTPGSNAITALALSADGNSLAVGGDNGVIQVRDAESGDLTLVLRTQPGRVVTELMWLAGDATLVSQSATAMGVIYRDDAETLVWDPRPRPAFVRVRLTTSKPGAKEAASNSTPLGPMYRIEFSSDSSELTWTGLDEVGFQRSPGRLRLDELSRAIHGDSAGSADELKVADVAPTPSRRFALLGRTRDERQATLPGRLVVLDAEEREHLLLAEGKLNVTSARLDDSHHRLLTLLSSALSWYVAPPRRLVVKVWGLDPPREIWSLDRGEARGVVGTLSPDGTRAAWVEHGDDGRARLLVWEVGAEQPWRELPWNETVSRLEFSFDNRWLAVAGTLGSLNVVPLKGESAPLVLEGHQGRIQSLAFLPDSSRLVSGGADQRVRVWDATTGEQLVERDDMNAAVEAVAVSPDGRWICASDARGQLVLWDGSPLPEPTHLRWPPSLVELDTSVREGRATKETWLQRAQWMTRAGDLASAAESLMKAAEMSPGSTEEWREATRVAYRAERWELVDQACAELIKREPALAEHWLLRAEAHARQLKFSEAAADCARGEEMIGNNLEHKFSLVGLLWLAGDDDGARRAATQAREQAERAGWVATTHANATRNKYLLARLRSLSPQAPDSPEQALKWGEEAVQAEPTPWHWHALGMLRLRVGDWNAAREALENSRRLNPEWAPELNDAALALVMLRQRDDAESRAAARRCLGRYVMSHAGPLNVWHLHDCIGLQLVRRELESLAPAKDVDGATAR